MSDDKNKRDFRDRDRINVNEKYELEYWTKKFGLSAEELKKVLAAVGPMVKDVEKRIKK